MKVLPESFTRDPEYLARPRREAHVLASLNHPNIAAIHEFEDRGDVHALVMELVDGPTLGDRFDLVDDQRVADPPGCNARGHHPEVLSIPTFSDRGPEMMDALGGLSEFILWTSILGVVVVVGVVWLAWKLTAVVIKSILERRKW